MKQVMNFRLSNRAVNTLLLLQKKTHYSKTALIEKALQLYAQRELAKKNPLLAFAGILDEREATKMLDSIALNKQNKDIEIEL